ncbi:MAG: SDR family oxidoreductase [Thiohalocapsa sp.]|jgi:3-oxoacyl-[acyl-carrier protein] reductase|uniref:SDR family NAD(P)-dependent oxidoreductase n=1 Tax=Thiohalocapsa sp. TaxID=2497641 RepID=UPI0025E2BE4A|nr:SDR family oxidoreductase [Thiohalocapsa sp.]MCG6940970.1 SDR family oxidoreductase [Thiohalocapsa sp.]
MSASKQGDAHGRVALISGASAGLGRAIALGLARDGMRVGINYAHDAGRAGQVLAEVEAAGGTGMLLKADVREPAAVDELYRQIADRLGPVAVLVLNASGPHPQVPFEEQPWAIYQAALDDFVKAPYLLTRACLPAMKAARWGRIVTIGSDVCFRTVNHYSAYVTAKSALLGFTRSMATELAPFGITVNTVAPGWVPVERHFAEPDFARKKAAYETGRVPMGRVGEPADIVAAVRYFAAADAGFATGQYLCVNGGVSLM